MVVKLEQAEAEDIYISTGYMAHDRSSLSW